MILGASTIPQTEQATMNGQHNFKNSRFKTAVERINLMNMLTAKVLPSLDDMDDDSSFSINQKNSLGQTTNQPRILVTPKATNRIIADRWVRFEDAHLQRQFTRRLDDFSYRDDVSFVLGIGTRRTRFTRRACRR